MNVALRWNADDVDFKQHYLKVPNDASELEIEFRTRTATPGAEAGLFVATHGEVWPDQVRHENADRVLRAGVVGMRIRTPADRWPAAYFILIRAGESDEAGTRMLDGTLVARVAADGNRNAAPQAVGTLEDRTLVASDAALVMDVARAFSDPDGDALTYVAVSSPETVAEATAWGSTVTVTPVAAGTATVVVTATDRGGSNGVATQRFTVCVGPTNVPPAEYRRYVETWRALDRGGAGETACNGTRTPSFTDHPIRPGVTPPTVDYG